MSHRESGAAKPAVMLFRGVPQRSFLGSPAPIRRSSVCRWPKLFPCLERWGTGGRRIDRDALIVPVRFALHAPALGRLCKSGHCAVHCPPLPRSRRSRCIDRVSMKGRQILVEPRPDGGCAAALMIDGRLEDLLIDPAASDHAPRPGAIYRAVAARPMKGMGGTMLDLGGGATGYLSASKPPANGASFLVQVSGWAEPGKAAPVSRRITIKGAYAILTPGAQGVNVSRAIADPSLRAKLVALATEAMRGAEPGVGLIVRSLAADLDAKTAFAEITKLRGAWMALDPAGPPARLVDAPSAGELARREWRTRPDEAVLEHSESLAEAGVWEMVNDLLSSSCSLGAGSLAVEATRALVAIDVDTGGDNSPAAALKTNLAAVREAPRALRLRGLGGQIVIDFAPLAKRDRPRIEAALRMALRQDQVDTTIAGWTPLGHLELLRKRSRRPLTELPRR
jgi:ribonuclease G